MRLSRDPYVFVSERKAPLTPDAVRKIKGRRSLKRISLYDIIFTRFPGFSIRIGFNLDLPMVCSGGDHGLGRSAHPAVCAGRRRLQDCDVRRSSEATRPGPEAVRRRGPDHGNLWRTAGPSRLPQSCKNEPPGPVWTGSAGAGATLKTMLMSSVSTSTRLTSKRINSRR